MADSKKLTRPSYSNPTDMASGRPDDCFGGVLSRLASSLASLASIGRSYGVFASLEGQLRATRQIS